MSLLEVVVLAVVQGLTEFLPISSTAHLILVPWLVGWQDPGLAFDVALHAGTLVAVLAYFARTWWGMLGALARRTPTAQAASERRLLGLLVGATLPAALAGYFLEPYAQSVFRSPLLVAVMLLGVAGLMWWADQRQPLARQLNSLEWKDAATIGVAQAVAIIPGTSRAGITIAAGLFRHFSRESAARFSFMLSTPIIAGATLLEGIRVVENGLPAGVRMADVVVGFVFSALSGYAAIAFLLRYLQVRTLKIFVAYRVALGIIILVVEFLRSSA